VFPVRENGFSNDLLADMDEDKQEYSTSSDHQIDEVDNWLSKSARDPKRIEVIPIIAEQT